MEKIEVTTVDDKQVRLVFSPLKPKEIVFKANIANKFFRPLNHAQVT